MPRRRRSSERREVARVWKCEGDGRLGSLGEMAGIF